jgi:hypothetical protein
MPSERLARRTRWCRASLLLGVVMSCASQDAQAQEFVGAPRRTRQACGERAKGAAVDNCRAGQVAVSTDVDFTCTVAHCFLALITGSEVKPVLYYRPVFGGRDTWRVHVCPVDAGDDWSKCKDFRETVPYGGREVPMLHRQGDVTTLAPSCARLGWQRLAGGDAFAWSEHFYMSSDPRDEAEVGPCRASRVAR